MTVLQLVRPIIRAAQKECRIPVSDIRLTTHYVGNGRVFVNYRGYKTVVFTDMVKKVCADQRWGYECQSYHNDFAIITVKEFTQ